MEIQARFCDASWLRQSGHPLIPQGRQTLLEERAKRSFRNREYPLLINSLAEIAHADCDSALGQSLALELQRLSQREELDPYARSLALLWQGLWRFFNAECDAAQHAFEATAHYASEFKLPVVDVVAESFGAMNLAVAGRCELAQALIERLAPKVASLGDYVHAWYHCAQGRAHRAAGRPMEALRADQLSLAAFERVGFLNAQTALLGWLAADAAASGDPPQARAYVLAARQRREGTFYRVIDAVLPMIECKIHLDQGQLDGARRCLERSFDLATNEKVAAGLLLWCGDWLPGVLGFALEENIATQLVHQLIQRFKLPAPAEAEDRWPRLVTIRTLGRFELYIAGSAFQGKRKAPHKVLDLLRLLVANGALGMNADAVAQLLWPDVDGDASASNLRTAVHRLRKLLGDDAALQWSDNKLSLNTQLCWIDAWRFDATRNDMHGNQPLSKQQVARLERALGYYHGHLLPDHDSSWLLAARDRLQTRFHQLVLHLAQHWIDSSESERAESLYKQSLEIDPCAEVLYRQLMLHLRANGRFAEAAETYRRCERSLARTTGGKPSAAVRAVFDTLGQT